MKYESPKIIEDINCELQNILAGSVVAEESEVESTGQEIVEHNFVNDSHWE